MPGWADPRPPLAVINQNDQGGAVLVCGGLGLAVCAVSLIVRAYVRSGYMNSTLGADDFVIAIAFVRAAQRPGNVPT
jgi:hypothetical protein